MARQRAAAAGIDPGFQQLDEDQARELLREACETAVLRALESGSAAARRLCMEMGFRGQGKFGSGLAPNTAPTRVPESGLVEVPSVNSFSTKLEATPSPLSATVTPTSSSRAIRATSSMSMR